MKKKGLQKKKLYTLLTALDVILIRISTKKLKKGKNEREVWLDGPCSISDKKSWVFRVLCLENDFLAKKKEVEIQIKLPRDN